MRFTALLFCFLVPALLQSVRSHGFSLQQDVRSHGFPLPQDIRTHCFSLQQDIRSHGFPLPQDIRPAGQQTSDDKKKASTEKELSAAKETPSAMETTDANMGDSLHDAPPPLNRRAIRTVAGIQVAGYTAALIALNHAWYKDHPRTSLHFYNDMADWKQMDKLGHLTTTYHLSRVGAESFRLSGMDRKRSAWLGSASGLGFMTVIEIMDGLSEEWGFSVADQAANMLGPAIFVGQEYLWQEQRLTWKFSFQKTELSAYRPELLGSSLAENIIKDYNGMSFWASFNPGSFLTASGSGSGSDSGPDSGHWEWLPTWLNIAIGYGAYGMLGGSENPTHHEGVPLPHFERHRRWLLSPDIDLTRIPTQSQFLKTLFHALNFMKVPAPAIEYNSQHGWQFHLIYF